MKRAIVALGFLAKVACTPVGPPSNPEVDAGTSEDALADATVGDAASCNGFASGRFVGRTPASVTETSGIAASLRNPGTFWVHNDAGAEPRVHAIARAGTVQAVYDLGGVTATDWEDIAVGPGAAGSSALYIGDIGDNNELRSEIVVYRVAEPDVKAGSPDTPTTLSGVEQFTLVYPDRAHNAEALLVDPRTGDVYVVVKKGDGVSPVFRAAAPLVSGSPIKMEQVRVLRFGVAPLSGDKSTTGGSISPSGEEIIIRSYDAAFLWRRVPGSTIAAALASSPCQVSLEREEQGEAIGFAADGSGYYSVSEGSAQPIYFYARR